MDTLRKCWDDYTAYLLDALKHSSHGTFKLAILEILDSLHFTVTVSALTAQKFVEQERMMLIDQIFATFNMMLGIKFGFARLDQIGGSHDQDQVQMAYSCVRTR